MDTNLTNRKYKIGDAELCMFVSNLCNSLTRDLPEFESYGLTAEKIAEFKALGDAFEIFPPDITFLADIMIANEEKNILREQILDTIRIMAMRVKLRWGANSGNYKRLDFQNPSLLSDDLLLVTAMSIYAKMTEYLPDLSALGLTQTMLDDFNILNSKFENSLNMLKDATVQREEKTKERIEKANELYRFTANYCNMGKLIFRKKNPAHYKSYIINRHSTRKSKKIEEEIKVEEEN
jgi:hypothetical protein